LVRILLFDDISIFSDIADVKTIVLHPAAAKALDKMPVAIREKISQALHNYAITGQGDAKAMIGTPTVRLRVGDNRVIFDETKIEIVVLAIGNRREIYR
jgi:mRNA interferase RelE/StbE